MEQKNPIPTLVGCLRHTEQGQGRSCDHTMLAHDPSPTSNNIRSVVWKRDLITAECGGHCRESRLPGASM